MRLLLIEDHPQFSDYVKSCMEIEGFTVDACATIDDADAAASSVDYDAVILDLGLPDGDGMTLLKSWRSRKMTTPVLILSARDGVDDRVQGLNAGADDYVQKPVARKELVARIHALLRRPEWYLGEILSAGNVTLDSKAREVSIGDVSVLMPRREMTVLELLLRRWGRVIPKSVFEDKIYGFGEEVTSNCIEVHISRLRKRLAKANATVHIQTRRGVGYLIVED